MKKRDYLSINTLYGISVDETLQEKIKVLFDPEKSSSCSKSTVVLKKTLFKTSFTLGTNISIDFDEELAFQVFATDNNEVFKSESIMAIIEYKYSKIKWLLWL